MAPSGPKSGRYSAGQLVVFGPGDHLVVTAADPHRGAGRRALARRDAHPRADRPLRAVRDERPRPRSSRRSRDYQAGRLGTIPADQRDNHAT